jgi:hypothetical protein
VRKSAKCLFETAWQVRFLPSYADRRPIVYPEWLSLQDAAAYTGYSEQQFSDFVKRGIAPKSVLFSRKPVNAAFDQGCWRR